MLIVYCYPKSFPIPGAHWRFNTEVGYVTSSSGMPWYGHSLLVMTLKMSRVNGQLLRVSISLVIFMIRLESSVPGVDHRGGRALSFVACWGRCQWLCVILEKTFLSLNSQDQQRGKHYSKAAPVRCGRTRVFRQDHPGRREEMSARISIL